MRTSDTTPWVKATASDQGDSCVEQRRHAGMIEVRDTKDGGKDRDDPTDSGAEPGSDRPAGPKKPKKKAEEKEAEPEVEVGFAELSDDEGLGEETFDDLDFDVQEIPFSDSEEESEAEEDEEEEEGKKKGNEDEEGEEKGQEANNEEL